MSIARTVVLEASAPAPVDWSSAELWRVIVTARGVPRAAYWIPGPGRLRDPEAFTERVIAGGRERLAYEDALERFRRRLGIPEHVTPHRTCTVIVCTHRRSAYLPGLLDALTLLDPAPEEIIVVDNDPGELDCRDLVEAVGARYLREDRRGLDHARTTGLEAAAGDLVAFTDDDCVPAPRWLSGLDELFADASVGAVTGPAFAYELDSPAQVRFEREGGFTRGALRRRTFDWTILSPPKASATGAGANMVFRRHALVELDVAFPSELDAGTPTQSGGDLYALYRLLAAGWRVVYDPGTYVFHRHRPTPEALHRAFFGYGVGLSATLAKVLLERGEPEAVRAWWWLVRQYRVAQRERLLGHADAVRVRVAWDYLRGGLRGPGAFVRARALARATPRAASRAEVPVPRESAAVAGGGPSPDLPDGPLAASVIVPTAGRPASLARCLAALGEQTVEDPFEIIVVDDAPPGSPTAVVPSDPTVRVIEGGGRGAAAARNAGARAARGEVLLFLDDDLVPSADLVRRHLAHHVGGANVIAVGPSPPRPPRPGLVGSAVTLWWEERFREMAESGVLVFSDVLSGNASIRRAQFLSLGGFEEGFGTLRREDWHWGIRALEAGTTVEFDRDAVAVHEFVLTSEARLAAAFAEGRGDALLARRWPTVLHALPAVDSSWHPKGAALALALRRQASRRIVMRTLDALERRRLRGLWWRIFQAAQGREYMRGRRLDGVMAPPTPSPTLVVDPLSDQPLPPPRVCAPTLRLDSGDKAIEITPEGGRWHAKLAESLAVAACSGQRGWWSAPARPRPDGLITVAVGPGHRGTDRDLLLALEAPGVEVRRGDGPVDSHWSVLDQVIRGSATEVVATVIPGTLVGPAWLDELAATIDGDRVAMALGGPLADDDEQDGDIWMMSRFDVLQRYPVFGRPFGYLAIRRAHYLALGGFDRSTTRFGPYAPVFELAERALDRGLVVAKRDLPQVARDREPRIPILRHEWQRQRARGALLARRGAPTRGGRALAVTRGAVPLVALLLRHRWPTPKAAGPVVAYACGVAEGLVAGSAVRAQ